MNWRVLMSTFSRNRVLAAVMAVLLSSTVSLTEHRGSSSMTSDFTPELTSDSFDEEAFAVIAFSENGVGPQASAPIRCHGEYDYPHPGKSSHRRAINAHMSVSCRGGMAAQTRIQAQSRMTDTAGRMGRVSSQSGLQNVKVGGDLNCTTDRRNYRAVAAVKFTFPAQYVPRVITAGAKSVVRSFRLNSNGMCW